MTSFNLFKETQRSGTQRSGSQSRSENLECFLCKETISKESILFDKVLSVCKCLNCSVLNHLNCMANHFLTSNQETFATQSTRTMRQLIPVDGDCPRCECRLMWGDLIKKGVSKKLDDGTDSEYEEDDDEENDDDDFVERNDEDDDDYVSE